jgi:glycosyltransferase involved in cell wall biosynthesis
VAAGSSQENTTVTEHFEWEVYFKALSMRILYFHQHFTTPSGAGGTRSYEMARALIRAGHTVTMVCGYYSNCGFKLPRDERHGYDRGDVDGIDVIAMWLNYSNRTSLMQRTILFARFAWQSVRIAFREPHDLLFATSTPLTAGIPGIVRKLLGSKSPFIFEVRDLWPELPAALGMKNPFLLNGMGLLEWLSYRYADACVALSPGIVEGIQRRSRNRRVEMIPNGCDIQTFRPELREPLNLPGIASGDFVAGFTGAHGIANGLDAVLDAAAELKRRRRTNIKFVFIGDGNRKDALVARAKSDQLSNCIFLAPVTKAQIARITASFDCGLQILADVPAFYYGTSPNKFFDYISVGIPVVNNYPGWLAEIINEYQCGLAIVPGDPVKFADALEMLASEHETCSAMGKRARELAASRFRRELLAQNLIALFESLHPEHAESTHQ